MSTIINNPLSHAVDKEPAQRRLSPGPLGVCYLASELTSLTTAPLPPQSVAKIPKTKPTQAARGSADAAVTDIALTAEEMVELCMFYVAFLLSSSLVAGVAMVATKFNEITRVLFSWVGRAKIDISQNLVEIVSMCVEEPLFRSSREECACTALVLTC
jgi:hypothetical protein